MEQAALNKKKSKMEVKGAGLQVWEPKAAGRDGGSEHISRIWDAAYPWTLLPPLYCGQTLASVCPRLLCTSSSPRCGLHRAPWWGGMGKYPWHNLRVWYCSSSCGTGDPPSLNLATAQRDPTLHHPQAALLPPSH